MLGELAPAGATPAHKSRTATETTLIAEHPGLMRIRSLRAANGTVGADHARHRRASPQSGEHGPSPPTAVVAAFGKPVRQGVGEVRRVREVTFLEVGRRDLHAEVARAILTGAEVAEQRQERSHLAALVSEMDAVDEDPVPLRPKPLDRLEVVLPVAAADHECGKAPLVEHPGPDLRFQE